jgi:CHAT domain-containing protein
MTRAVLAAGARNARVSLWAVTDAGTATFMDDVCRRLAARMPADRAVREARRDARARGEPAALWAAFVHAGAAPAI